MRSTAVSISSGSGRVGGASSMSIGSSFPSAIAGGALRRVSTATCSSARGKPAYGLTSDRREAAALERILRGCASTAMAPMVCRSATTSVRRNTRGTGGDDDALVSYDDDATAGSRARRHADTGSRPCTARTRRWHRGPGTVPGLAPVPRQAPIGTRARNQSVADAVVGEYRRELDLRRSSFPAWKTRQATGE